MPTLSDLFGDQRELTAAIQKSPYVPSLLARRKLFQEKGVRTTKVYIEYQGHELMLVPSAPRGGVPEPMRRPGRGGLEFSTVHLPVRATVYADEVQDQRAFGTEEDLDSPEALKQRVLASMRQSLEFTLEYHRAGALRGLILDSDGSTLLNVFTEFGISQLSVDLELDDFSTDVRARTIEAERTCEDALGGLLPSGFLALAAPDVIDAITGNQWYRSELLFPQDREEARSDGRYGIRISNTLYVEYRSPPDGPVFIPPGEAYLIPLGIPDLLITRFAPADTFAAVNQPGLPIYASAEMGPHDKFASLLAQSNPLSIPTRPRAIVKLLKSVP